MAGCGVSGLRCLFALVPAPEDTPVKMLGVHVYNSSFTGTVLAEQLPPETAAPPSDLLLLLVGSLFPGEKLQERQPS